MQRHALLTLVLAAFAGAPLAAQVNFTATPILQTGITNVGGMIAYPRTDSAEVTALMITIGPGGETGRHQHMYPTFVYVLEGSVDVEADGGMAHIYKAGDSFLEALNTWHNGRNTGTTPARILVVFAGVKGRPNLVRPPQ